MIPPQEIAAELGRELAARRAAYPGMIERLRMTQDQADYEMALCAVWQADLARYAPWLADTLPRAPIAPALRSGGYSWHDRRNGIARELDRRARLYPKWIAAGSLDEDEAAMRTARLSAMADLYDEGFDWHDSFGTRPPFGARFAVDDHTPAERESITQWWAHVHHVHQLRRSAPAQEQLAL